jgi:putative modified peptide
MAAGRASTPAARLPASDVGYTYRQPGRDGTDMSTSLSPEQGLTLFKRLADDDDFRARFQADPPAAMAEAGIDPKLCETLSSRCCQPRAIGGKKAFADLVQDIESEAFALALEMEIPKVSID